MANLVVRCRSCGQSMVVAVYNLKWIRCSRCHKRIYLNSATIIQLAPMVVAP